MIDPFPRCATVAAEEQQRTARGKQKIYKKTRDIRVIRPKRLHAPFCTDMEDESAPSNLENQLDGESFSATTLMGDNDESF